VKWEAKYMCILYFFVWEGEKLSSGCGHVGMMANRKCYEFFGGKEEDVSKGYIWAPDNRKKPITHSALSERENTYMNKIRAAPFRKFEISHKKYLIKKKEERKEKKHVPLKFLPKKPKENITLLSGGKSYHKCLMTYEGSLDGYLCRHMLRRNKLYRQKFKFDRLYLLSVKVKEEHAKSLISKIKERIEKGVYNLFKDPEKKQSEVKKNEPYNSNKNIKATRCLTPLEELARLQSVKLNSNRHALYIIIEYCINSKSDLTLQTFKIDAKDSEKDTSVKVEIKDEGAFDNRIQCIQRNRNGVNIITNKRPSWLNDKYEFNTKNSFHPEDIITMSNSNHKIKTYKLKLEKEKVSKEILVANLVE